jgi:hypothetical protein
MQTAQLILVCIDVLWKAFTKDFQFHSIPGKQDRFLPNKIRETYALKQIHGI